jgi:hypothetical protein
MSETGPQMQPDDALVDLLIKQVTEGLSPAEQRELDVLDSAISSRYLRDFERAAAAISLAATPAAEVPPPALLARLEQDARAFFASATVGSTARAVTVDESAAGNVLQFEPPKRPANAGTRGVSRSGAAGWFAAAACLLLAIFSWFRSPQSIVVPPVAGVQVAVPPAIVSPTPVPAAVPTPAEERAALLAQSESLKITLGATKDPAAAGVTGDVVWDPVTQKGFLHFVGLATNDPQVRQYQIWIFDGERDKRYPVDGGVFDVPANSPEVVIPIHAALPIRLAKAFAVTVEKPGGVVVSGLAHVVVLGSAS